MEDQDLIFVGFFAGVSSAALGIGGGVVMVPMLALLFGYGMKRAIGTSLGAMVVIALVGTAAHYAINSRNIYLPAALLVLSGSLAGAKAGAFLTEKIRSGHLAVLFAVLLVVTGLKLTGIISLPVEEASAGAAYPLFVALGVIAGAASALLGIGGGVIMVPAMNIFFGLSIHEAIATSLAVILPTSLAGAVFHARLGNVDVGAMKFLLPAAFVGAILGAIVSNSLPAQVLKPIFGAVMMLSAVKMVLLARRQKKQERETFL